MHNLASATVCVALSLVASTARAQCTKDADCKGDNACVSGACVSRGTTTSAQPAKTPVKAAPVAGNKDTWKDARTGLTWQRKAPSDEMDWKMAQAQCKGLRLEGRNDWRLPQIGELRTLLRGCETCRGKGTGGESECDGCETSAAPDGKCTWPSDLRGDCAFYWSSSSSSSHAGCAWGVYFTNGGVGDGGTAESIGRRVRCVRGGP